MTLVYHLIPRNLMGKTLYPLNQMREQLPDVYDQHIRKYQGREALLLRRIPFLDCLWNDVLFFAPLHPQIIRAALSELGQSWRPRQWLEIDPQVYGFNATNTVIYESEMSREKGDFTINPNQVTSFSDEKLISLEAIPPATLDHYRVAIQQGKSLMLWHGVTHVLHRGTISIGNARVFEI